MCGSGDPDNRPGFDFMSSQAFLFKTDYKGDLVWKRLFYPDMWNYTHCNDLAWAGDATNRLSPIRPLVFLGHHHIIVPTSMAHGLGLGVGLGPGFFTTE